MTETVGTHDSAARPLGDPLVPVRAKLAAGWTSFMFLYIYVDYFHLHKPGVIDNLLLYIPYSVVNAAGESWDWAFFYGLSLGLEVLLLAFILRTAWTWPRTTTPSM